MTVDFGFARTPAMRVAYRAWTGPWSERRIRAEFERLAQSIRASGGRTGRWIFREPGNRKWEVAIELKGPRSRVAGLRLRTVRGATVARVVFDPEEVAARLVYHGLTDWLRWRRKDKEIRSVGGYREVYPGNPWTDKRAWSRTEVQVVVRR